MTHTVIALTGNHPLSFPTRSDHAAPSAARFFSYVCLPASAPRARAMPRRIGCVSIEVFMCGSSCREAVFPSPMYGSKQSRGRSPHVSAATVSHSTSCQPHTRLDFQKPLHTASRGATHDMCMPSVHKQCKVTTQHAVGLLHRRRLPATPAHEGRGAGGRQSYFVPYSQFACMRQVITSVDVTIYLRSPFTCLRSMVPSFFKQHAAPLNQPEPMLCWNPAGGIDGLIAPKRMVDN